MNPPAIHSPGHKDRQELDPAPGGRGDERLSPARRELAFGVAFVAGEGEAAGSYGAEVIYSKDLADGQSYGDVRVIHPLK